MIELASVVRDLRGELEQAVAAGEDEALRFELGPIELEVAVAVERSAGGGGKVRFWVAELGADGRSDTTRTQRITLTRRAVSTSYRLAEFGEACLDAACVGGHA
jgi:hypothetical protein